MFRLYKICLALNVAPEGLLWHLTVTGDAPGPSSGTLTPATRHSVPSSRARRIAGREEGRIGRIGRIGWREGIPARTTLRGRE